MKERHLRWPNVGRVPWHLRHTAEEAPAAPETAADDADPETPESTALTDGEPADPAPEPAPAVRQRAPRAAAKPANA